MDNIYKKAIEYWGEEPQLSMLNEEMAELTIAVNKHRRNATPKTLENITEEMADVLIMIKQIAYMFNIHKETIDNWEKKKIERMKEILIKA